MACGKEAARLRPFDWETDALGEPTYLRVRTRRWLEEAERQLAQGERRGFPAEWRRTLQHAIATWQAELAALDALLAETPADRRN